MGDKLLANFPVQYAAAIASFHAIGEEVPKVHALLQIVLPHKGFDLCKRETIGFLGVCGINPDKRIPQRVYSANDERLVIGDDYLRHREDVSLERIGRGHWSFTTSLTNEATLEDASGHQLL